MKKSIISLAVASLMLTGCGAKFQEEYPWMVGQQQDQSNDDESGLGATDITILEKELRAAIPYMINYSHEGAGDWQPHNYQYQRANNVDNYAGYWTTSKGVFTFGGPLTTLYMPDNDYLGGPIDSSIFQQSKNALFHAEELGKPEWRAIALIIQGYLGHELTDFYGGIPFTDWRNVKRVPPLTYEGGWEIYQQIFSDLDEAIAILKATQPSATELEKIEDPNKTISQGDWQRWVKFANSLKLRMAMNIVNVHPDVAQTMAEEAVNDEIGVLVPGDMDLSYHYKTGGGNALYKISVGWNDLRLGASLENILKHFNNPLLNVWFDGYQYPIVEKSTGIQAEKGIYGVRAGIAMINTVDTKSNYGPFGVLSEQAKDIPHPFIKVAEVIFNRAEGALRGWNMGGTAQEFYEMGIRQYFADNAPFDVNGTLDVESYLAQDKCDRVDYVDPLQFQHNTKGLVTIGVKWNDADDNELKLEKIITQKYIGIFPLCAEAWTTFRRTSYPRLFPVYINAMAPDVDTELHIRRMTIKKTTNNAIELAGLEQVLGGPQHGGTRVFWDNSDTWTRGDINPETKCAVVLKPNNF